MGSLFLFLWKVVGFVTWPFWLVHSRSRRHVKGLLAPEPGRTWIHGASAGEHVIARSLANAMTPHPWRTHMSMRTPVPGSFPAPLDLPFVFSRWLDRARPTRLILIEAELWPGWMAACRARRIPIIVVGSRPSASLQRWRKIPGLWNWLIRDVLFLPQSEIGDLKLGGATPASSLQLSRPAFIAASTRVGDEARLIHAWPHMGSNAPLLILAPRRMQRVPEVHQLTASSPLRVGLRSENVNPLEVDVLILDTMGELAGLFSSAQAAFIGGTFDAQIGGHSPAEAFRMGIPVISGPHRHANPAAWKNGWCETVAETVAPAEFAAAIQRAIVRGPGAKPKPPNIQALLQRLPTGDTPSPRLERPWLWPLVPIWGGLSRRRKNHQGTVNCPVISVGGLTAGGSGKTPAVAWLAAQFPNAWVVSRGYRRDPKGPAQRVGRPNETPQHDLGDELEMLRRRGISVVSSPDRIAGAQVAQQNGAQLIFLDDGYQNRSLARELDIVCIDQRWPRGRGRIPVGTGRSPWSALQRANWLWLHHPLPPGCPTPVYPPHPMVHARNRPIGWRIRGQDAPLSAVSGSVDVVVGIARPEGFICTLLDLGLEIRSVRILPDHGSLPEIPDGCVVTEKDAARLPSNAHIKALMMGLDIEGETSLIDAIRGLVHPC